MRYFIAWLFVCAVPLPAMYLLFGLSFYKDAAAINTTVSSSIALLLGLLISRRLFAFPGTRELTQGISAVFAGFALVAGALLMLRIPYSVTLFGYSLVATALLMIFWRGLFRNKPRNNFHLLPFGDIDSLSDLASINLTVMDRPVLPGQSDVSIVADFRADIPPDWERMLATATLQGIPVLHFKLLRESIAGKVKIEHLSENNLGSLIPDQGYKDVKWALDRVAAVILIPVLAPILIVIALIIKLHDGGSVLYRQRRIGWGGKPFTIYKFRSMATDGDSTSGLPARESAITVANDKRITRFGAFMRKYRIDELPQIFNILKGEMSFIGPRPEAIALAEWYESELPFYSYRHIVRPGLTGWAQVHQGHVADIDAVDFKLQYDFYYVKYFSAWLDIIIMLRTIRTVLTGFGSK